MDIGLQDEIDEIIENIREYKEQMAGAQERIDEIDSEIEDLVKSKHPYEDQIEGFEDDIANAKRRFVQILDEATELDESPADYIQRALGKR